MNAPVILDRFRFDAALATTARRYELLIDGIWCQATDRGELTRTSPAHGLTVSTYARAGAVEVRVLASLDGRRAIQALAQCRFIH